MYIRFLGKLKGIFFQYNLDFVEKILVVFDLFEGFVVILFCDEYDILVGIVVVDGIVVFDMWIYVIFQRVYKIGWIIVYVNGERVVDEDDEF